MRGRLANAVTALVSGLLSLALAEFAVRGLGLAPDVHRIEVGEGASAFQRSANPVLGFELRPGYRSDDPDFVVSYPRINSHGQRDVERSVEKPSGTRRILLLGDSVVEGAGIRSLDHTISRRLEELYEGAAEVLNFGVSGYCTRAEVELLEVKGLAFDPDVVVLVFVENDFENFNRQLFELGSATRRPPWVEWLFLRSQLFRALAIELDWFHLGVDADPMDWNRRAIGDNNVVDGLARLRELADRHGFEPLVAVWPRFTDDAIEDVHFMPGRNGEGELVVERLARAAGIPSVRLSEYFRRDWRARGAAASPRVRYTTGDEMHPSRVGARVAARALRDLLARLPRLRAEQLRADPTAGAEEAVRAARARGLSEPNYAIVYNNVGNKLAAEGRLADAARYFRRALAIDPDYEKPHNNLGNVLARQGRPEEALASYRRAVQIAPRYADALFNLAGALAAQGRVDEAAAHYERALRERPDWPAARERLAELREAEQVR